MEIVNVRLFSFAHLLFKSNKFQDFMSNIGSGQQGQGDGQQGQGEGHQDQVAGHNGGGGFKEVWKLF